MSRKPPGPRALRTIDWPAIEADYRAGLAVLATARRHGVNPSTIYRRAYKHKWASLGRGRPAAKTARPRAAASRADGAGASADGSGSREDGAARAAGEPASREDGAARAAGEPASREDGAARAAGEPASREDGAASATRAQLSPAAELGRLRALAARLRERLEGVIEGERPCGVVLGGRESPVTVLLKLCQITEKIIAIERGVAGAQAPTAAQLSEQDREILERFKRRCGVG